VRDAVAQGLTFQQLHHDERPTIVRGTNHRAVS
jgi:hypothetical protein